MNYYEHHLGDWAAATGHLSWDEDMAYTRLLRAYYHAERPIPDGQQYRLAKASTAAQRKAVDAVLSEFFQLIEGQYRQKRADEEIARFHATEPERNAKKANEELRLRRHREERGRLFEALRAVGHYPDWNISMAALRALHDRTCNAPATPPATPQHGNSNGGMNGHATAIHSHSPFPIPDTIPNPNLVARSAPARQRPRGSRIPDDFELTPERREYATRHGVDPDRAFAMFTTYWRGKAGAGASKVDWDATWQHWCLKDRDRSAPRKTRFEQLTEHLDGK